MPSNAWWNIQGIAKIKRRALLGSVAGALEPAPQQTSIHRNMRVDRAEIQRDFHGPRGGLVQRWERADFGSGQAVDERDDVPEVEIEDLCLNARGGEEEDGQVLVADLVVDARQV